MVNKRGWLRIVEASIAVLIVLTFLMVVFGNKYRTTENDLSNNVGELLQEIASNTTMREAILDYNTSNSENDSVNREIIEKVRNFTVLRIKQKSLGHDIRICPPDDPCGLSAFPTDAKGDVYARERIISAVPTQTAISPKKVKLFLWRKS